ncbi:MAG: Rpn family recombination-promoting nuclease/putative transposase [Marinilabiliaceae bacterium]|nr:Rpn family recombination-promoting nuclease/putative transposase [Marinilabiliaceae bacterium]
MAEKTNSAEKPPKKYRKQDLSIYINLLTDFGFKRVFGIKEVMLNFLNTVLNIEGGITDLTYGNVEILGLTKNDRKAIFDLICITGNGERIIVEIQNIEQEHYRDRMLVYASQLIQEQNVKGKVNDKYWNFKLDPIYSINIMNFLLGKKKRPKKYLTQWQLKELDTNEVLYDKLTFVCVELPLFSKKLRGVKTALEQWIFLIKSLHELKNIPKKYKTEIFQKIFEMAKIAKMSKEEVKKYIKV